MSHGSGNAKKGFFAQLKTAFSQSSQYTEQRLQERYQLQDNSIKVPYLRGPPY